MLAYASDFGRLKRTHTGSFFLTCNPLRFLFISGFFEVENTMQLLKKVGRSIFFDVNPISQPVTGCAQSSKKNFVV